MTVLLLWVLGFIVYFLVASVKLYKTRTNLKVNKNFNGFLYYKHKGVLIEILWTLTPALILVTIAIPSFALLYSTGFYTEPEFTFKAVGNQWYWKYEYTSNKDELFDSFESFLVTTDSNFENSNGIRLLAPSMSINVPVETNIRVLVTSRDVLHSWSMPALAIKLDACPGRLNEGFMFITIIGIIFGTCSEICGVNHAFMPTSLNVVSKCAWS
tara:strand:+ start:879 stop:1517 length:639 start_codon:yes stop_codon:yes gene_type:complete